MRSLSGKTGALSSPPALSYCGRSLKPGALEVFEWPKNLIVRNASDGPSDAEALVLGLPVTMAEFQGGERVKEADDFEDPARWWRNFYASPESIQRFDVPASSF